MKINYLVIEGNIGAGKTSLVKMIARDFGARMLLEQFKDNPFLSRFYENQEKYAFPLEMSFLAERYRQLNVYFNEFERLSSFLVSDYYFAKSLIFARNTLTDDEFRLYQQFYDMLCEKIPKPDLYVYLHADTEILLRNIDRRNRSYEQNIQPEYLEKINEGYSRFHDAADEFPVLLLDITKLDFVENKRHYKALVSYLFDRDYMPGLNRII